LKSHFELTFNIFCTSFFLQHHKSIESLFESCKIPPSILRYALSQEKFKELAEAAKVNCPISRLYAGGTATIELDAKLV